MEAVDSRSRASEGNAQSLRIPRPALDRRLADAIESGALVLTAPAGYGKTMALEEALSGSPADAAWVYCASEDCEPGRLLVSLLDALQGPAPGLAETFKRRLSSGSEPVDPGIAVRELLAELSGLLVERLVLVFEEVEVLAESPSLELLAQMLKAGSENLRVVIASRRSLDIPLAKLRATGKVTEVGTEELSFSVEECAELMRRRHGREPEPEQLRSVMEPTQGWPLGVALADMAGGGAADRAPGAASALFDFLAEEVLRGFEPEFRDELTRISLADDFDATLVEALGIGPDFLDRVSAQLGQFVQAVEGGEARFRFHPLLREFLQHRAEDELSPKTKRGLRARIALMLQESGRAEEAIEHWLACEEWERASAAIGSAGGSLLGAAPQTVRGWLERLPDEARSQPQMMLLEGQLVYGAGDHAAAAELQRRALAAYRDRGDSTMDWAARLALMNTLHASGGFDEAVALAEDLDSEEARENPAAPNIAVMAAMCLSHQGRLEEAEAMIGRALDHPAAEPTAPLAKACGGLFLDRPAGRLDEAVRKAREALEELDRHDPFQRSPFVRALLHLVLEEQGLEDEALAESLRAQDDARRIGVHGYLVAMLQLHSVGIHARAGRLPEAERELERASGFEHGTGWRQNSVGKAMLAAARGDRKGALACADEVLVQIEDGPFLQRVHAICFLAPMLVEFGQRERALALIDEVLGEWRPGYYRGRILALRSWLRWLGGDTEGLEDLVQAWEETGDQVQHLVRREWPQLEPILWDALERELLDPVEVIGAIQAAFPEGAQFARFAEHPSPTVRRAAIGPNLQSGNPAAIAKLEDLAEDDDPELAAVAQSAADQLRHRPPALHFRLLGRFEVRRGYWLLGEEAWGRPMAARIVRMLLVQGEAVSEDALLEAFWPEKDIDAGRRSLQVAVSRARAALDVPGAESSVIDTSGRTYRLVLRDVDSVDAHQFEATAKVALAERGDARARMLEGAAALWAGEPLPDDSHEQWSASWRERLRDRYAEVLAALVEEHRRAGDVHSEVQVARRLVELDPINESAQRALIRALARVGRRGEALRQYLECRRSLVEDLGVEPSEETIAVQKSVLAGEPI